MSGDASGFIGDIPAHYDAGLGPNLFEGFAELLAEAACSGAPTAVLELAAGTGIVSRKLRDRLPAGASLTVSDLSAPMLEVARAKFAPQETVAFAVADALRTPFPDAAFDRVVCQFGVMFFPDKRAAFREARRVLKPGGRFLFNAFGPMEANPHSQIAYAVPAQFFAGEPPGFYKAPFHYGDPAKVRADLAAAGWRDVSHETLRIRRRIADAEAFARGLVYGNPLIDEIRARGGVDPETVCAAVHRAIEVLFAPTDMTFPMEATVFVCTAE
ncbi:class I SAM-dependent methyltransferase [Albimonas pacifica]|uniref:Ubiquinone/menaquinone biosynthesis C-methylase UbiE n=1 Tax=Albimonas pacifica TaxID=1114924 RepID=A0A1I3EM10_9RHOB|nr:methyltransferase domain-containing protein [Albimonas pacifica]SFH99908.1 Ubiquinone/menaquinone biosynthesis C-methylase UbiE [Albimonas pacifica]